MDQSAIVPVVLGCISFAGGAVMAALVNKFTAFLGRPIISARLVEGAGCYVETQIGNPAPAGIGKFLRLRIENRGKSSLKDCQGYIIRIVKKQHGQTISDSREVLDLGWAHQGPKPMQIPTSAFFYMDIVRIRLQNGAPTSLSFVGMTPNNIVPLMTGPAEFELTILVAADNAKAVERSVRFRFDPQKQDIEFDYDQRAAEMGFRLSASFE
jgi:hypothetical protein